MVENLPSQASRVESSAKSESFLSPTPFARVQWIQLNHHQARSRPDESPNRLTRILVVGLHRRCCLLQVVRAGAGRVSIPRGMQNRFRISWFLLSYRPSRKSISCDGHFTKPALIGSRRKVFQSFFPRRSNRKTDSSARDARHAWHPQIRFGVHLPVG